MARKRAGPPPPERLFYAPPPTLRQQAPAAFFALLSLVSAYGVLFRGQSAAPLIAALAMTAAGVWIAWRRRWPWRRPALRAGAESLTVNPDGARPVTLAWRDVVGTIDDGSDDSIVFDPRDPAERVRHLWFIRRGPAVPRDIRTRDGVYFVEVIEDYWEMPRR